MKKLILSILLLIIAMTTTQAQNPFFSAYKTPYDTPPFDKIKNEHYEPAIEKGIKDHTTEINKIVMIITYLMGRNQDTSAILKSRSYDRSTYCRASLVTTRPLPFVYFENGFGRERRPYIGLPR